MTRLESRRLGHSAVEVSAVGLGCNNFGRGVDRDGTRAVINACEDHGVTLLDTADVYGATRSEEFIGEALAGRRDRFVIATKFGMDVGAGQGPRGSRDYIRWAVEGSLRRLRTDVIDVYWYHRPDGVTPLAETLEALDELVRAGTVRAIGASNFTTEQIEEAHAVADQGSLTRFCAIQNEYSLLVRDAEAEVLPVCERLGLGFVPYFPLASGLLTGKYARGAEGPPGARLSGRQRIATDAQWQAVEALSAFASKRQVPLTAVAIGALLARRAVSSVIAGATRPEHVAANVRAAGWKPSEADLSEIEAALSDPAG